MSIPEESDQATPTGGSVRERLVRAAYLEIAKEKVLSLAGLDPDGLPKWVPPHWREEAEARAKPYIDALRIGRRAPERVTGDVDVDWYAERLLGSQEVRMGPLARRVAPQPVDPLDVAAVLRGMADFTMNSRLIREVIEEKGMCPPGDPREPSGSPAVSLGRWFHRVADVIEQGALDIPD